MSQDEYDCLQELNDDEEYQQWLMEVGNNGMVIDSDNPICEHGL